MTGSRPACAPSHWRRGRRAAWPEDVDVLSVYDDYPAMVLVQLEDLGYMVDGDLERLVDDRIASRASP